MGATGESARPSSPNVPAARDGRAHQHIAAVLDSAEQVHEAAAAYVDAGLRAGDLVVLACPPETVDWVRRTLLERAAGARSGRLRILGQVVFGADAMAAREGERYESAANAVLADAPLTAMCLYDRSALPSATVEAALATHQLVLGPAGPRPHAGYRDPLAHLRGLPVPREPVEAAAPVFEMAAAPSLPGLRHALGAVLDAHVADEEQRGDLYLGVSEVAANAFRHGVRPVSARVWADGVRLVCSVTDAGRTFDDPLAGFVPAHGMDLGRGGMGLWLARKLFDAVDLLPGEHGFTVRLSTALRPAPSGASPATP